MQITNCRTYAVNNSASGDTTIINAPGEVSQPNVGGPNIGCITVWGISLEGAGANVIQFKSGTTAAGGPITFTGAGSTAWFMPSGVPYVKCAAGQDLVMNLGSATAVTGTIWYTLG